MIRYAGRAVIGVGLTLFLISRGTMLVRAQGWKEKQRAAMERQAPRERADEIKRQTRQAFKEEVDRVLEDLLRGGLRLDRVPDSQVAEWESLSRVHSEGRTYRHPRWSEVVVCVFGGEQQYYDVWYAILPKGAEREVEVRWSSAGGTTQIYVNGERNVNLKGVDKPEDVRRLKPKLRRAIEKAVADAL